MTSKRGIEQAEQEHKRRKLQALIEHAYQAATQSKLSHTTDPALAAYITEPDTNTTITGQNVWYRCDPAPASPEALTIEELEDKLERTSKLLNNIATIATNLNVLLHKNKQELADARKVNADLLNYTARLERELKEAQKQKNEFAFAIADYQFRYDPTKQSFSIIPRRLVKKDKRSSP